MEWKASFDLLLCFCLFLLHHLLDEGGLEAL